MFGQELPRACKAIEQLILTPGCRVSECRLGGLSTVLLGSEAGPRFETRGDLLLLDRECEAKLSIPGLFAAQKKKLKELGFAVEGSEEVNDHFGAMVFQQKGHWLELTGLLLEGSPTLSIRSVRTDGKVQARRTDAEQPERATALPVAKESPVTLQVAQAVPIVPAVPPEAFSASGADQDRQPRIIARTDVPFPPGLEQAAASAITLEVALDEKGAIARVLSTKGNPMLLSAALQAVRNWTFEPALASGKPVPGVLSLDVSFKHRR